VIYRKRKALEWKRNLAGEFATQAALKLETCKIGKSTGAYKWYSGMYAHYDFTTPLVKPVAAAAGIQMLPPAHIHARARRYAVKLFLAHLHHVWYKDHYKADPPLPYAISVLGHAHYLAPPGIKQAKNESENLTGPHPRNESLIVTAPRSVNESSRPTASDYLNESYQ